jgi:hypothetical protein
LRDHSDLISRLEELERRDREREKSRRAS